MTKMYFHLSLLCLAAPVFAADGAALVQSKNCIACHQTAAKIIGPSYKDIAARYSSADAAKLAAKIVNGSEGVWGKTPMPATSISNDDAMTLANWILSQK